MNRKPTFSIRGMMLLTLFVLVAIVVLTVATQRKPRPYKKLERFTTGRVSLGWTIEVLPDIEGPFRTAGDDWSGAGMFHCNSGQPATGWVDSGTSRRLINYPGRAGVSYFVALLENRDDQPTYLIFSRPDRNTTLAPIGN